MNNEELQNELIYQTDKLKIIDIDYHLLYLSLFIKHIDSNYTNIDSHIQNLVSAYLQTLSTEIYKDEFINSPDREKFEALLVQDYLQDCHKILSSSTLETRYNYKTFSEIEDDLKISKNIFSEAFDELSKMNEEIKLFVENIENTDITDQTVILNEQIDQARILQIKLHNTLNALNEQFLATIYKVDDFENKIIPQFTQKNLLDPLNIAKHYNKVPVNPIFKEDILTKIFFDIYAENPFLLYPYSQIASDEKELEEAHKSNYESYSIMRKSPTQALSACCNLIRESLEILQKPSLSSQKDILAFSAHHIQIKTEDITLINLQKIEPTLSNKDIKIWVGSDRREISKIILSSSSHYNKPIDSLFTSRIVTIDDPKIYASSFESNIKIMAFKASQEWHFLIIEACQNIPHLETKKLPNIPVFIVKKNYIYEIPVISALNSNDTNTHYFNEKRQFKFTLTPQNWHMHFDKENIIDNNFVTYQTNPFQPINLHIGENAFPDSDKNKNYQTINDTKISSETVFLKIQPLGGKEYIGAAFIFDEVQGDLPFTRK